MMIVFDLRRSSYVLEEFGGNRGNERRVQSTAKHETEPSVAHESLLNRADKCEPDEFLNIGLGKEDNEVLLGSFPY